MGGRARLSSDASEIKIAFGMPPERPAPHCAASWNVAPTDPLSIVRDDAKDHRHSLQESRWPVSLTGGARPQGRVPSGNRAARPAC